MYEIRAAEKLREQGSRCQHISLFIATGRYGNEPQYANTASLISEYPTSNTRDIINFTMRGLSILSGGRDIATLRQVSCWVIFISQAWRDWICSAGSFRVQMQMNSWLCWIKLINPDGEKFDLPVKCWWPHTERQQNLMSAKLTKLRRSCGSSGRYCASNVLAHSHLMVRHRGRCVNFPDGSS